MRSLFLLVPLALLLSCKNEPKITPGALVSLEYGNLSGLAGAVATLTVYPQKQVLQPYDRLAKPCEEAITASEWNELTRLFDEKAFKKIKTGAEPTCADAGAAWIVARSANGEVKAEWWDCTEVDTKPIKPLIDALSRRMQRIQATCQ